MMLETTVGALANELEAEQRYRCAVSNLTARPVPRRSGPRLDSRCFFLLLSPLPALLLSLQTTGPHGPGAGHMPSHHLHQRQIRCLCFAAMDRLCFPASAPSGPAHPGWPAGLSSALTGRGIGSSRHRCLSQAEHTQGSTCSDAFSIKTMSSLKATATTTKSEQRLIDR